MNTNLLIGLVVGAVVVGGGYFLIAKRDMPLPFPNQPVAENQEKIESKAETQAQEGKFNGSLAELAARGGSWKCTVDITTAQSVSSGITYSSGGKVRGDFTTKVQGYGNVESHMITDGTDVYTWTSVTPQGFKTKMSTPGETAVTSGQAVNTNQPYTYDCESWTTDVSVFVIPSDITFK